MNIILESNRYPSIDEDVHLGTLEINGQKIKFINYEVRKKEIIFDTKTGRIIVEASEELIKELSQLPK